MAYSEHYELCFGNVMKDLEQHVIDMAFDQRRHRLTACVSV